MDGLNTTIEFNCGKEVKNVGNIELALKAHKQECNCEN
jgi:hypothetical protein